MKVLHARVTRLLSVGIALLGLGLVSMPATASAAVPFTDTVVQSWGVNGTVRATAIAGDTVVVGGTFTAAVSPTGVRIDRRNLAAFSLSTGELLTDWRADTDNTVSALGTNGSSVWAGGTFTTVGGTARSRLVKLDAKTGAVDPNFSPRVNNGVKAVEVAGADLFIGGAFSAVNGVSRKRLAKLHAGTGALDAQFAATADKPVYALALSSTGTLFVSGTFTLLNGVARLGVGGVNAITGAISGPAFAFTSVPVHGLDVSPGGTMLFGAQKSNQLTAWTVASGSRKWQVNTDGNAQAVKYFADTVYFGFHDGYRGDTTLKLLAVDPTTGAVDPNFKPAINSFYGVFAIDASAAGLVVGGAFTKVSGVSAQRMAIFH